MWHIAKLSGQRAQIKDKLATVKGVPEAAKTFIAAQVDALPADCTAVIIDAFGQEMRNPVGTTLNVQVALKGIQGG